MATSKPRKPSVYLVTTPDGSTALVRALSSQRAIRHMVSGFTASRASPDDILSNRDLEVMDAAKTQETDL